MVAAHRDAAAEAYDALQRGSEHVNHAYAGVIELTKAPHLADENHDWVVGTLASVVEAMVAAGKATPTSRPERHTCSPPTTRPRIRAESAASS